MGDEKDITVCSDEQIIRGVRLVKDPLFIFSKVGYDLGGKPINHIDLKSFSEETTTSMSEIDRDYPGANMMIMGPHIETILYEGGQLYKEVRIPIQMVASNGGRKVETGEYPAFVYDGSIDLTRTIQRAKGITAVRGFVTYVNIADEFSSWVKIADFEGGLFHPDHVRRRLSRSLLRKYLLEEIDEEGRRIEKIKGERIKGISLSGLINVVPCIREGKILGMNMIPFKEDMQCLFMVSGTYLI